MAAGLLEHWQKSDKMWQVLAAVEQLAVKTGDIFMVGPPDLTVPGFGVPIGSAYLSARRTFGRPIGRPKVRFNPSPPLVLLPPNTNTPPPIITNKTPSPPPLLAYYKFPHPPFPSTPPPRPQSLHAKVFFVPLNHPPPCPQSLHAIIFFV